MRTIIILVVMALLSACSTPQPRATIPVSQYREAAQKMYALGMCNQAGFVDTGIAKEGFGYISSNHLGDQFDRLVLEAAFREAHATVNPSEEDMAKLRDGSGLTEEEAVTRGQFQARCVQFAQDVVAERQRRHWLAQQNAQQRQEAINRMAQQMGNMGQMMMEGGNNALRNSQSLTPSPQPNFGLPSPGYNHSLINSPGGLRQRHCTATSSNTQYCFE